MQPIADWYFALVFFVAVLGFVVAGILFFVNKANTFSSRLLAAFLITISIVALNNVLMATTFFLQYPHFWRVVVAASFCVAPLGYLYVRSVLEQSCSFRRFDFLFFVPAVLYTLTLIPFYTLPVDKKLAIISGVIANNGLIAQEPEGILPSGWGAMSRIIYGIITNTAQFLLLARWKNGVSKGEKESPQNSAIFRWLFLFTLMMSSLYVLLFMTVAFQLTLLFSIWQVIILSITITILFICLFLLFQPSILYGLPGSLQKRESLSIINVNPLINHDYPTAEKKQYLSPEQGQAYKVALEAHFEKNHPFRKAGYTIGVLSQELDIPSHQLSAFINQEYGKHFNELINEYRVDFLADLIRSSPEYLKFTLEALGKEAGFNSRAAFITAVKKKTGLTPSEYYVRKD